jgi:hypothetical protein
MRRVVLILATAAAGIATAACGGGDVAVIAQLEGAATGTQETEMVALGSLPVRLVPFDRDAIFDSLGQAYPEPEPAIPDSIQALQDRVISAQAQWREANQEWAQVRDSLQMLSDTLRSMNQADPDYFVLFQDFGALENRVGALERRANEGFEEFTTLQGRLSAQSREIELARRNWADEAFASVDSIFTAREEEIGMEVRYDTTSTQGVARFSGIPEGQWWVTARYERPFDELYWNVPVDVPGGEEITVRLTEENAEVRQKL